MHKQPMRPAVYGSVAITPTSTSYTVQGIGTAVVRLQPSIDCWAHWQGAAVTVVSGLAGNSMPLTAFHGAQEFLAGQGDVISFISNDATSGFISVTEMSR